MEAELMMEEKLAIMRGKGKHEDRVEERKIRERGRK